MLREWLPALSVPEKTGKIVLLSQRLCNSSDRRHPGGYLLNHQPIHAMIKILLTTAFLTQFSFSSLESPKVSPLTSSQHPSNLASNSAKNTKSKIQVALLLDTSNSMDGLIDQAKAQLWKMVNRLADAQRQNEGVELEIALFEYGNSGLEPDAGYIRLVHPLGTDLDGLSEKLFELKTNGGDEYCGWVIQTALKEIPWSSGANDLRIIFIAGNEPFNQGPVNFRTSCGTAADRGILINTIHCGDFKTGLSTDWKTGADLGRGKYMIIDTDKKVTHISTPFDARILECNEKLNRTYLGYGAEGAMKKERQVKQDNNAASYGASNVAQRAAAKSKSSYRNEDWDLVDAARADEQFVEKLEESELPAELKGKNKAEIKKEIARLGAEREEIRKELAELEKKMSAYIAEETKKQVGGEETLDLVLIQAVVDQAKAKGFVF